MLASMIQEFGGIPKILPVADDNELDIYKKIRKNNKGNKYYGNSRSHSS